MSYQEQPPYGGYGGAPINGTGGWGAVPPPYPGGHGGGWHNQPPQPPASQGSAIAALVLNIVALFTCYGSIPATVGLILAGIALGTAQSDPGTARKLTLGAWICFGVSALILVGIVVLYLFFFGSILWLS